MTTCSSPTCDKPAAPHRALCWACMKRESRTGVPQYDHIPRSRTAPGIAPERLELYRRIAEESKTGRSLFAQAEALNVSHGQLKHLRQKAYVYGFEIAPVNPENRHGVKYETAARDAEEAAKVPRCPRCFLALPHECMSSITEFAASRRGESAGLP